MRALCRRHETGGADGDGWDEEIKGGLTKLSPGQLAAPMELSRNARLGDQLFNDRRHRGITWQHRRSRITPGQAPVTRPPGDPLTINEWFPESPSRDFSTHVRYGDTFVPLRIEIAAIRQLLQLSNK